MAGIEIPNIANLPEAVSRETGTDLQVFLHEDDSQIGPILRPMTTVIRDSIGEIFQHHNVPPSRDLEILCTLAARVAVSKLVTSDGFRVEFGAYYEPATRILEVPLKQEGPEEGTQVNPE